MWAPSWGIGLKTTPIYNGDIAQLVNFPGLERDCERSEHTQSRREKRNELEETRAIQAGKKPFLACRLVLISGRDSESASRSNIS
jgi:hypothetical protein